MCLQGRTHLQVWTTHYKRGTNEPACAKDAKISRYDSHRQRGAEQAPVKQRLISRHTSRSTPAYVVCAGGNGSMSGRVSCSANCLMVSNAQLSI